MKRCILVNTTYPWFLITAVGREVSQLLYEVYDLHNFDLVSASGDPVPSRIARGNKARAPDFSAAVTEEFWWHQKDPTSAVFRRGCGTVYHQ